MRTLLADPSHPVTVDTSGGGRTNRIKAMGSDPYLRALLGFADHASDIHLARGIAKYQALSKVRDFRHRIRDFYINRIYAGSKMVKDTGIYIGAVLGLTGNKADRDLAKAVFYLNTKSKVMDPMKESGQRTFACIHQNGKAVMRHWKLAMIAVLSRKRSNRKNAKALRLIEITLKDIESTLTEASKLGNHPNFSRWKKLLEIGAEVRTVASVETLMKRLSNLNVKLPDEWQQMQSLAAPQTKSLETLSVFRRSDVLASDNVIQGLNRVGVAFNQTKWSREKGIKAPVREWFERVER